MRLYIGNRRRKIAVSVDQKRWCIPAIPCGIVPDDVLTVGILLQVAYHLTTCLTHLDARMCKGE